MRRPLQGCRVLDLGIITAGAATGALLADLGAEVIKIESPNYRDPFRTWLPNQPGGIDALPPFFRYTNRNKTGISLDLKQAAGRDVFLKLVSQSHIVLENFRRGVMARLGIDYPALKAVRNDIILASLSSQGESGPDSGYVSYGTTLEAMSGLSWLTGYAGDAPVASGKDLNYPDQVVAIFAAGMITVAWFQRQQTGQGAHLDISQRELVSFLAGETFLDAAAQTRRGNGDESFALQDCFSAGDGWIAISVRADQMSDLGRLLPSPDGAIAERLCDWLKGRSRIEATHALCAAGIAAAPVLDGAEVLARRGRDWNSAIVPLDGENLTKGFPFQFRHQPMTVHRDAPRIGADTEEILREIGHYSAEEITALRRRGVIESSEKR
jgi:crotonobetainyl-CoA:carnitine CoA-transferase CaiB-like acyl-CoA transferase